MARRLPSTRNRFKNYRTGEALYAAGRPPSACENCHQRAGWYGAEYRDKHNQPGVAEAQPCIQ